MYRSEQEQELRIYEWERTANETGQSQREVLSCSADHMPLSNMKIVPARLAGVLLAYLALSEINENMEFTADRLITKGGVERVACCCRGCCC